MPSTNSNSEVVMAFVKRRKGNLIKVFDSKCCICGFDKFQQALEFHHVNPEEKEFGICDSHSVTKALSKQLQEMKKCILVCANCHRGIHTGYYKVPDNWKDLYNESVAEDLMKELEITKGTVKKTYICQQCGAEVTKYASSGLCVECARKAQRRVERPSREVLKDLVRNKSFLEIGRMYGVTDNSIKKWCDAENIPRTKREIKTYTDEQWLSV